MINPIIKDVNGRKRFSWGIHTTGLDFLAMLPIPRQPSPLQLDTSAPYRVDSHIQYAAWARKDPKEHR